jgi:ribosomal protein L20A (L18A)
MANVLKQYRVIIVGSDTPDIVRKAKMIPAENMEKALETVFADLGNALKIILIPNSLSILPMMESQNQ